MSIATSPKSATVADWLAQPEDARLELIDAELIPKAAPTMAHGQAEVSVAIALAGFVRRPGGPTKPGGWWIASEVDILLDGRGFRPDLAGWRREHVAHLPRERPMMVRPDWICEIVSESNRTTDTVKRLR
ncbi:MAG: Uma2 family endonuclease [Polyangiaceae bacterium]